MAIAFGDTGINISNIKPRQLALYATPSRPDVELTSSTKEVSLGNDVSFSLSMNGGTNTEARLFGNGIDLINPSANVIVAPTSQGLQVYSLDLPGFATLTWDFPANGNSVILHTPHVDVDVTEFRSYKVVSSANSGLYSIVQVTKTGVRSDAIPISVTLPAHAIARAEINVLAPASSVAVFPQSASYTVRDGPAAGRSFRRSWSDGAGWHAYLGRDGVAIGVQAMSSDHAIASIELQGKTPNGDWADLLAPQAVDTSQANGPGVKVSQTFSVRLGNVRADKPVIPSDPSLAGIWQLRARALTSAGTWSDWSPAVPLTVEMPLQSVSKTGQTLPPIKDAAWFTASDVKTYNLSLWIP